MDDYAASDAALPLPGLDDAPAGRDVSKLELAARRSIGALHAAGLLDDSHAVALELVLSLSRAVGRASDRGQAAAAAMGAAQLREAWAMLPTIQGDQSGDEWDQLARELREASEAERRRHAQARMTA